MAIQMIGAAAACTASTVGSVVISISLSILTLKIAGWAEKTFRLEVPDTIGKFGFFALLFGLDAVSSYALTSQLLSNYSYETLVGARVANSLVSLFTSVTVLSLEENIPNFLVNKSKTN